MIIHTENDHNFNDKELGTSSIKGIGCIECTCQIKWYNLLSKRFKRILTLVPSKILGDYRWSMIRHTMATYINIPKLTEDK